MSIMKNIIPSLFILISLQSWSQDIDLEKRLEYYRSHRLFVMKLEYPRKNPDQAGLESLLNIENSINGKMKTALEAFWDLNDSIYYFEAENLKDYKKKYPDDFFLIWESYSDLRFLSIQSPKKNKLVDDISPRLPILKDTTLLGITQEIRLLRCNIINGDVWYSGPEKIKTLLFLDEPVENVLQMQYIKDLKAKYRSYDIVDRQLLTKLIYSRDPQYIYITNMYTINVEDGSFIQLE